MGDVCGKGAQAAAVTAMVRYTIRAAVMRNRSPAGILRWLNSAMLRQRAGRFVTIAIARLELEPDGTVIVTVSSGGHPLPRILRSTGLVEEIGTTGTLLGVLADVELEDRSAPLVARRRARALHRRADRGHGAARVVARAPGRRRRAARGGARAQGIVDHLAAQAEAEAEGPPRDDLALLALRGSALAVGVDVDVVDLPRAARRGA